MFVQVHRGMHYIAGSKDQHVYILHDFYKTSISSSK